MVRRFPSIRQMAAMFMIYIIKNIRVEQAEQKLFDIKVLLCRYTEQLAKGEINDIYFDNIQVLNGDIPVSMIRGVSDTDRRSTCP